MSYIANRRNSLLLSALVSDQQRARDAVADGNTEEAMQILKANQQELERLCDVSIDELLPGAPRLELNWRNLDLYIEDGWVQQTGDRFEFFGFWDPDNAHLSSKSLVKLIKKIEKDGCLGRGFLEGVSEQFDF